jgi:tetratricopeptide (TPR) repeat protein
VLSVCFIARNEEKALPRALASVKGVADEIIVTDTGSTDRTAEVAKEMGATVVHFPWCDDFSAARNFSISHARGDWILWLDSDEELLPDSVEELRACMARQNALAFYVLRQDLKSADRLDYYTVMWQLRLFRRHDDLRFLGRCHPDFQPDIDELAAKTGLRVEHSGITLRHYGYVAELTQAKLQRAARLLQLELKDRPGQLYYLIEYGRTLLMLDDPRGKAVLREASAALLSHAKNPEPPTPIVSLLLEQLLQWSPAELPPGYSPALVESMVTRWFPTNAPLLWLLAQKAAMSGQFADAERLLRRLVAMGKDHSYEQWVSFDPRLVGEDAKFNLGACLVRQGKAQEALTVFKELLASPKHGAQARAGMEAIEQFLRQTGTQR